MRYVLAKLSIVLLLSSVLLACSSGADGAGDALVQIRQPSAIVPAMTQDGFAHVGSSDVWADPIPGLYGETSAVSFGMGLNGSGAEPWARGIAPIESASRALDGKVEWNGSLLGQTSFGSSVTGNARLSIEFREQLDYGLLHFEELTHANSGEMFGDGDLLYVILAQGNSFTNGDCECQWIVGDNAISGPEADADAGIITGAFFGSEHEGMGGTLERHDMVGAFGGDR